MNKYQKLWDYVANSNAQSLVLSFGEAEKIAGVKIDHSFLTYKKELSAYGYEVKKISLKNQTIEFERG